MNDVGCLEILIASQGAGVLETIADFNNEPETKLYKVKLVLRFGHSNRLE